MAIELPPTDETDGQFKIHISKTFKDSREEAMLKTAEAVYHGPSKMAGDILNLDYWAEEIPKQMSPIWGVRGNDDVQSASIVTASAVRYYFDLTLTVRRDPHLPTGFTAVRTDLKYNAAIKHLDLYSHKKDMFKDVNVADLTLKWAFSCSGKCGMGFTRNKVVVTNGKGNVVAIA